MGAARRARGGERPAARALHGRSGSRRNGVHGAAPGESGGAGAGCRGHARDRLRPGRAAAARTSSSSRARSARAAGSSSRITYWNAEGALAAVGLVLCARLAGDRSRPPLIRALAAAAAAPLGAGVYLSYSRGAIAAALARPARARRGRALDRPAPRGRASRWPPGRSPPRSPPPCRASPRSRGTTRRATARSRSAVLVIVARRCAPRSRRAAARVDAPSRWAGPLRVAAVVAVVAALAGVLAAGLGERPTDAELGAGAGAGRLTTVSSNRYEYWRVAARCVRATSRSPASAPAASASSGCASAGSPRPSATRTRSRSRSPPSSDLPGLLAFVALVAGVALAARRALARAIPRRRPARAAALPAWFLHASIDWDWQLPAVTLPAIVLAGRASSRSSERPSGSSRRARRERPPRRTPDPARA